MEEIRKCFKTKDSLQEAIDNPEREKEMKTIDVDAKEWFDRVNGNSYFSGTITVDYGMESEKVFLMKFQYGYGSSYEQEAKRLLTEFNIISPQHGESLSRYCNDNQIILRTNKETNCLKRDLKAIATDYNEKITA